MPFWRPRRRTFARDPHPRGIRGHRWPSLKTSVRLVMVGVYRYLQYIFLSISFHQSTLEVCQFSVGTANANTEVHLFAVMDVCNVVLAISGTALA